MNSLNSILLEGNVKEDPRFADENELSDTCRFCIESVRYHKKNGDSIKTVSQFEVEAKGKLCNNVMKDLLAGRGIRVVGRVDNRQEEIVVNSTFTLKISTVIILAEHIEFKPTLKSIKTEAEEIPIEAEK